MKKSLFILTFLLCSFFSYSQEGTFLIECELYRIKLMKNLNVTTKHEKEEKKGLLQKTQSVTQTLSAMEKVYESYQTILKTFETATGVLNTYREIEEFKKEVEEIIDMYKKFGGTVFFNTFYDADKYLNPEAQKWYCQQMKILCDKAVYLMKDLNLFRGNKVKMQFEDRLNHIRSLCFQIKGIKYQMYRCINIIQSLVAINIYDERDFYCRNSCFDYKNYHYGSSHNEAYFQGKWEEVNNMTKKISKLDGEIDDIISGMNIEQSEEFKSISSMYSQYDSIYEGSAAKDLNALKAGYADYMNEELDDVVE